MRLPAGAAEPPAMEALLAALEGVLAAIQAAGHAASGSDALLPAIKPLEDALPTLDSFASRWETTSWSTDEREQLGSVLARLGPQIAGLDGPAQRLLLADVVADSTQLQVHLLVRLLFAVAQLAWRVGCSMDSCAALLSSITFVLGSGACQLPRCPAEMRRSALRAQLGAVHSLLSATHRAAGSGAAARDSRAAAARAAIIQPPKALGWLVIARECLSKIGAPADLRSLYLATSLAVISPQGSDIWQAVQQRPAVQRQLARAAVDSLQAVVQQLQSGGGASGNTSWTAVQQECWTEMETMQEAAKVFMAGCLRPATEELLRGSGPQLACQLVQLLPIDSFSASGSLAPQQPPPPPQQQQQEGEEEEQQSQQLEQWRVEEQYVQTWGFLQVIVLVICQLAEESGDQQFQEAACWMALQCAPRLTAALQSMAALPLLAEWRGRLCGVWRNVSQAVASIEQLSLTSAAMTRAMPDQLQHALEGAGALLRMLPLFADWLCSAQTTADLVADNSTVVLGLALAASGAARYALRGTSSPQHAVLCTAETVAQLAPAWAALQASICRLPHWVASLAADGKRAVLPLLGQCGGYQLLRELLGPVGYRPPDSLLEQLSMVGDGSLSARQRATDIAAWEGWSVVADRLLDDGGAFAPPPAYVAMFAASAASKAPPAYWSDAAQLAQLSQLVAEVWRQEAGVQTALDLAGSLLSMAEASPRLCALMLLSGRAAGGASPPLMATAFEMLDSVPEAGPDPDPEDQSYEITCWSHAARLAGALRRLQQEGERLAAQFSRSGGGGQALQFAAAELGARLPAFGPVSSLYTLSADHVQRWRTEWQRCKDGRSGLTAAATAVADLLVMHWSQPAQLAADRLEVAQAAVTLPCAYLRCANLGGTMERKLRCSACRVAWYCGKACSHADWRQHRKVCKALGEQRLAAKAAAAAAAAATEAA